MSPEIKVNGKVIADVPDESRWHILNDGNQLLVDVSLISATNRRQLLILEGSAVGGKRIVGLTQEGIGNSGNRKKGGDGKEPLLEVTLRERPIRVSYTPVVEPLYTIGRYGVRQTLHNPRWMRGHGQR